jgi:hypothetical protein
MSYRNRGRAAARPYRVGPTCWLAGRAAARPYRFGELILPKSNPAFNGEFKITRRTDQMQVIRHQQIIAYQPSRGSVFPDVVERALNGWLSKPAFALFRANGKENPIQSPDGNVYAFGRHTALWEYAVHAVRMASGEIQGNSAIKR